MSKENGRFEKGNEIGKETRFSKNNRWIFKSKYNDEYADKLLDYFNDDSIIFPTIEGFARENMIAVRTLINWCNQHPRFAISYEHALTIQKEKLLVGGLTRKFEASLVKFIAANNHGMTDKTEQKIESDNTVSVEIKVVD